ncbi:MAG: class I SAM-dependent methyltransferase [Actinomycetota bacterium]
MSKHAEAHADLAAANDLRRRAWAKEAPRYDKSIGFFERRVFGTDHRAWACSQVTGKTLEVAVGTGLNLSLYPLDVELTGIDLSPEMLAIARRRAEDSSRSVDLQVGDAHALPFEDDTFQTVVCTYSLCNIPDTRLALGEMHRVLRDNGRLVLVDHVKSDSLPVFWVQKSVELFSRRLEGEHMTRRPLKQVPAAGFAVVSAERRGRAGIVERVIAIKEAT